MSSQQEEELARGIAELIRRNPQVRSAIWECACRCPNLVVEY